MKTKFLKYLAALAIIGSASTASGQDAIGLGSKLVGGAIGYAIGSTQKDKASWAPAAGAALGVMVGDYAATKWSNTQNKAQLDYYISGMNYQRWIAANKQWHTYTLDPHTGRPPAFAGLTQMDAGMGGKNTNNHTTDDGYNKDSDKPSGITQKVVQLPVVISKGEHGGVNRSERTLYFPRLP